MLITLYVFVYFFFNISLVGLSATLMYIGLKEINPFLIFVGVSGVFFFMYQIFIGVI